MKIFKNKFLFLMISIPLISLASPLATDDLGIVIERAAGRVMLINTTRHEQLGKFEGLGDLSHASAVFSRDQRFAYVFGRDGGLTKLDLVKQQVAKRIIQAGNSIGGAISQDGQLVATSNYEPGGVRIFDAETLDLVTDIPAVYGDPDNSLRSKVVGLVDAPGQKFIFSLYDAGEIWVVDVSEPASPVIKKFQDVGLQPYDGLITPDGRFYITGLFGENGIAILDLWNQEEGIKRVLNNYGRGEKELPVYKMPHLEGWASTGNLLFIPAVGHRAVHVIDTQNWQEVTRIKTYGQPVFAIARPDGQQVWVNYAFPDNNVIEVIDVASLSIIKKLQPGKTVLHMEFTPRGEEVWVSVRDDNRVKVYNTEKFTTVASLDADKPSGIFFTSRAHKIGL